MATTESSAANPASAFFPPCDKDKKPVWNKPCISSSPPLMGADSWPALSPLSSHKSPSSKGLPDGSSPMPQAAAATSSDYHSADNLSKDKHLRGQMNDEGWVPVRIIAGFRRLAELTDNIQTILEALRSSEVVEIKGEALRRRGDWDKYLLPHEPSSSGPATSLGSQLESMTLSERSREGE